MFIDMLKVRGIEIPLCHCSNSAGIVDIKEANTLKLSVVAYVIPLVLGLLAFFVGILLEWPDWANFLMFVGGCAVAYAIVALIDRRKKHQWVQSPDMVEILKFNKGE